jgi:asparagine synthase (glutamine-hydrolysing)
MCGILGILGLNRDISSDLKKISHRGPDGFNIWRSQVNEYPASLGHNRLAILDLSKNGEQPFFSHDKRYVFVFNGEIFNFIELKRDFVSRGFLFHTDTDTEIFLTGLISEGLNFQNKCNGMWAFCLWDRETQTALFGRDRFGEKPLFYSLLSNEGLVFSSEMKGLYSYLEKLEFCDEIDSIFYNLFNYESTENCVVKNIKRIPPGHSAKFQGGKITIERWWNTLDNLCEVPKNYNEQVDRWRELFLDSVKIRMRSDVKIGTALSGGLDSSATFSSMAHIASKVEDKERISTNWQNAYCAHYPGSTLDEVNWAAIVTDKLNIKLNKVIVDPLNSGWTLMGGLYQVEDPYLTLPHPMLATYRAISHSGIKVTIDGHGADELFSGYGHLDRLLSHANPFSSVEIKAIIESLKNGVYAPNYDHVYTKCLLTKINFSIKFLIKNSLKTMKDFFNKTEIDYLASTVNLSYHNHDNFKNYDVFNKSLYEIFHTTILPTLLRNYDRYSMANGVEIRMPFMDHRLVSYSFSLPTSSKVGNGFTKRIMRDALKDILPVKIRTRRDKIGWNAPLHEWLKDPLKEEINEIIQKNNVSSRIITEWLKFQKKSFLNFNDGQKIWSRILPIIWKKSIFINN